MIRAIVFDCFGVLYGGSLTMLLDMSPLEKREALVELNKQNDYGYLDVQEYMTRLADIIGVTPDEVTEIFRQKRVRNPMLFSYIQELRARGLKIGMLTNAGHDMPAALFQPDELNGGIFDAYVVSSASGVVKPNREAYELIAAELELSPGECLMVDDTESNIEGADAAGMPGIWFTDTRDAIAHIESRISAQQPPL